MSYAKGRVNMGFKCGIVGLPNVGKSTLFNALLGSSAADAQNYPFCTIDPNIGCIAVPDQRLVNLAKIADSKVIIPAQIEFVDIAGLVRGASKGEGLGNQFLGHIREVDCIVYVLRCFKDSDIIHVEGRVNPIGDIEIIETELILADIQSIAKRISNIEKKAKHDKAASQQLELMNSLLQHLNAAMPARTFMDGTRANELTELHILTSKPVIYVCNVSEEDLVSGNEWSSLVYDRALSLNAPSINISAKIEQEIAIFSDIAEKTAFLNSIGLLESCLNKLIRCSYNSLKLITFFTVGPKEAHAWAIHAGTTALDAARVIHTDFAKGFICAETISYTDYIHCNGEVMARETGKMRIEGKEYTVQDGEVMRFRFNI